MPVQGGFVLHSHRSQGTAGFLEKKISVISESQQLTSGFCAF